MSLRRRWLRSIAHLAGLCALVVVQPVFDVLARAPEFIVAHRADAWDVVALAAILVTAGPLVLGALVGATAFAGAKAVDLVTALLAGALAGAFAAQLGYRLGAVGWGATSGIALACVAAGALAWWRWRAVRLLLTVLAGAVVVVPLVFLSTGEVRSILRPRSVSTAAPHASRLAPVVLIVFDELPLVSLLDGDGRIDAIRYPHLTALAADGIWCRNATTVSDYTRWALPAILTGRYPKRGTVSDRRRSPGQPVHLARAHASRRSDRAAHGALPA